MNTTETNIITTIVKEISAHMKSIESTSDSLVGSLRDKIIIENHMISAYLDTPAINYAVCRKTIQPLLPDYYLTDSDIKTRAECAKISEQSIRSELRDWGQRFAATVHDAIIGKEGKLGEAREMIRACYSENAPLPKPHCTQNQVGLASLFKFIPELRGIEGRSTIKYLGRTYAKRCIYSIFDIIESAYGGTGKDTEPKVEKQAESDTAIIDRPEELLSDELSTFYSGLNSPEYGYLIDSLCINLKVCEELESRLPFEAAGIPIFMRNLMRYLIDSGVAPITEYPPQSIQMLTLAQLMNAEFLPLHTRTTSIKPGQQIPVKVLSSGWRIGGCVISQPILQEEEN